MTGPRTKGGSDDPGYISDVVYPSAYVRHQQPTLLCHVVAARGIVPPDPASPYVYLELGCGTGVTLNGLAAANPESRFVGIDFNREHIEIAGTTATAANLSNVRYIRSAFPEVAADALPETDFIAIQGTYSWLDPDAQTAVHDIVARVLKPGGLFYVEYMALPGHAHTAPLMEFVRRVSAGHGHGSRARVTAGMAMLAQLQAAKAGYLVRNPAADKLLTTFREQIKTQDSWVRRIAHNALSPYRQAEFFPDMRDRFRAMGLHYAGNLAVDSNDPTLSLPPDLLAMAGELNDPALIELVKDFHHNRRQRMDVYVKAPVFDAATATAFVTERLPIALIADGDRCRRRLRALARPPSDAMAADTERVIAQLIGGPATIAELNAGSPGGGDYAVPTAVTWLLAEDLAAVCKRRPSGGEIGEHAPLTATSEFNALSLETAARGGAGIYLASPVIGGCTHHPALEGCILSFLADGAVHDSSAREIVDRIRSLPGPFQSRQGPVAGASLGRSDIVGAYRNVRTGVVPLLVALDSLKPA
ncbi:MAG: methyltransferase domain-containing protein [Alphaproteobacteria bacterium]|nr:methyltransferase domain-containing protein [Alphaproteobacteria bacterium]